MFTRLYQRHDTARAPATPVPSAGRWPSTMPGLWWPPGAAEPGREEMAVLMPGGCVPANPAAPAVTASHRPRGIVPAGHAQAKTHSEPAIPASTPPTLITGFLAPPKSGNVTIHRPPRISDLNELGTHIHAAR